MTCLRCGQLGHWASSCPQNAKGSTSPSNKRPAPSTTTTEGMAVHSESALVQFQDIHGAEHPEATMLDPGASAFLSGYGPFKRYVEHLSDLGYPVNTIRFARCERLFQFGGDASSQARWTVNLPVMIDGSFGTIQCYLVPGNTPLLMGRPVIEALHMGINFSGKQVRFGTSPGSRSCLADTASISCRSRPVWMLLLTRPRLPSSSTSPKRYLEATCISRISTRSRTSS